MTSILRILISDDDNEEIEVLVSSTGGLGRSY